MGNVKSKNTEQRHIVWSWQL